MKIYIYEYKTLKDTFFIEIGLSHNVKNFIFVIENLKHI